MIRSRLAPFAALAALCLSTCLPSVAHAAISVASKPAAAARVTEARIAYAKGKERSTLWAQLRLDGAADEVLVIVPLPKGTVVDLGQVNLLDAIEEATAPRIKPPTEAPSALICKLPQELVAVTSGNTPAPLSPSETRVALSADEALVLCKDWGFESCAEQTSQLAQSAGASGRFVMMRFEPPTGNTATPLLRLNGPTLDTLSMSLLKTDASLPVPLTFWLIGTGRGRALGAIEHELPSLLGQWTSPTQNTYASERWQQLVMAESNALFVESAGNEALRSAVVVPGAGAIPNLVSIYLARAAEQSGMAFSPAAAGAQIFKQLNKTSRFADACPRADQGAGDETEVCKEHVDEGENDSSQLAPTAEADDLRFVFGGEVEGRWVTRLVGRIPSGGSLPDLSPVFLAGKGASSIKQAAIDWNKFCVSGAAGGNSSQGGYGGATGSYGAGGHGSGSYSGGGPATHQGAGGTQPGYDDGYDDGYVEGAESQHVDVSCSGSVESSDDSCSSRDSNYEDDESCAASDTSAEGTDDGCSSSDDSSSDGCSGDDSSGGDACDSSSSSGGGDACDSSSSSGGGDACSSSSSSGGDCTISRGKGRGRSKMSRVTLLLVAILLPLRRSTRRPRPNGAR